MASSVRTQNSHLLNVRADSTPSSYSELSCPKPLLSLLSGFLFCFFIIQDWAQARDSASRSKRTGSRLYKLLLTKTSCNRAKREREKELPLTTRRPFVKELQEGKEMAEVIDRMSGKVSQCVCGSAGHADDGESRGVNERQERLHMSKIVTECGHMRAPYKFECVLVCVSLCFYSARCALIARHDGCDNQWYGTQWM